MFQPDNAIVTVSCIRTNRANNALQVKQMLCPQKNTNMIETIDINKRLGDNVKKSFCLIIIILAVSIINLYAQKANSIEPYLGLFGSYNLDSSEYEGTSTMFGVAYYHEFVPWFGLGVKAGCMIYDSKILPSSAAISYCYRTKTDVVYNFDIGILPGIGVAVKHHHLNMNIFALIPDQYSSFPKGVVGSISYGYKIPF